jgi:hypothetical protein
MYDPPSIEITKRIQGAIQSGQWHKQIPYEQIFIYDSEWAMA